MWLFCPPKKKKDTLFYLFCFVVCISYLSVCVHNLDYVFWGLYMGLWPKYNKLSDVWSLSLYIYISPSSPLLPSLSIISAHLSLHYVPPSHCLSPSLSLCPLYLPLFFSLLLTLSLSSSYTSPSLSKISPSLPPLSFSLMKDSGFYPNILPFLLPSHLKLHLPLSSWCIFIRSWLLPRSNTKPFFICSQLLKQAAAVTCT